MLYFKWGDTMDVHNKNMILNHQLTKLNTRFILIDHGLCPDWSREDHTRMRDTLYLILDGKGKITVNGKEIYPISGDMVFLPKGSRVSLYSQNDSCYNKYWCEFTMTVNDIPIYKVLNLPYLTHLNDFNHARELFERLEGLRLKTDVASALLIEATLLELVSLMLGDYDVSELVASDEFSDKITQFVNKHITEKISIKRLADYMGFNEKYFIALFKKHFATTPAQFIKSTRLDIAKRELLYSNNKTTYIVDMIGYSSLQKFSKDFKAYTGYSPTEFRKKLQ